MANFFMSPTVNCQLSHCHVKGHLRHFPAGKESVRKSSADPRSRTYEVKATIQNRDGRLLPGNIRDGIGYWFAYNTRSYDIVIRKLADR